MVVKTVSLSFKFNNNITIQIHSQQILSKNQETVPHKLKQDIQKKTALLNIKQHPLHITLEQFIENQSCNYNYSSCPWQTYAANERYSCLIIT
jgi:hypothetical protein